MAIQGIIHENRPVDHEDDRRLLISAFNGDLGDFVARQVKFALIKEDSILGGHFHDYDELFYLLAGQGTFDLKDITNGIEDHYDMVKGDRLFIPRLVAHKAHILAGSILVGCTAQPYVDAKNNDHRYDF